MKRRSFLKAVAAVPAVIALPAKEPELIPMEIGLERNVEFITPAWSVDAMHLSKDGSNELSNQFAKAFGPEASEWFRAMRWYAANGAPDYS